MRLGLPIGSASGTFWPVTDPDDAYLAREARARKKIDQQLERQAGSSRATRTRTSLLGRG